MDIFTVVSIWKPDGIHPKWSTIQITPCEHSTRLLEYFVFILRYQIILLKIHQQDKSNIYKRQDLTEDDKSCYKQIILPSSSKSPQQLLLTLYNSFGISHQSNQWLFLWLWELSYAEASKTWQLKSYGSNNSWLWPSWRQRISWEPPLSAPPKTY